MPHVIIECSHNNMIADPSKLMLMCNKALMDSSEFKADKDIKSRLYVCSDHVIGLDNDKNGFIIITLKIMEGRSHEVKIHMIESLVSIIKKNLVFNLGTKEIEITCELVEIQKKHYYLEFIADH